MTKHPRSFLVLLFLFVLMIWGRLWKLNPHPISWDVGGYYLYLPAQLIYHDLAINDYNKFDSLRIKYEISSTFYQVHQTPKGKRVIKYTMGNSVLYAPFFCMGHIMAKVGKYPADGFSKPYQQAMHWGIFIYMFLALIFARKTLLHFFKDGIAAFTLLAIVLGTNLFLMISMDNLQTHCNLFFLYTLLIWSTIRYHKNPSYSKAAIMGLFAGLIILTRPTDIVSWLIPIGWGIGSFKDLWLKFKSQFKYFLIFFIIATVVFLPQMLYWKTFAGSWLYNSYDNAGEGLDLWSPHTLPFLFSYRKGWLVYTPLAIFMLIGIIISIKDKSKIFLSLFAFIVLNVWLVSSWTCWWYAGSFSSRAMIQSYAVLMIPLGFCIQHISTRTKWLQLAGKTAVLMLVFFCMFQTWQYAVGILKYDGMTKAYYWRVFGTTSKDPQNEKYVLKDKYLGTDTIQDPWNFEIRKLQIFDKEDVNPLLKLDSSEIFYTIHEADYFRMTDKYYAYVSVEGEILNTGKSGENPIELVRHMLHNGKTYAYSANTISSGAMDSVPQWENFKFDYIFPDVRKPEDKFKTYFWLRGKEPVYIRGILVSVLEAREFPELE